MKTLDAAEIQRCTPWRELVAAVSDELLSDTSVAPERQVHNFDLPDGSTGSLLVMPSWSKGGLVALKASTFFPNNAGTDTPTINAAMLLFDGQTGRHLAALDGDAITTRRTAACSALAASYLARDDASRLLVVGTGQLSANMARAQAALRPLAHPLEGIAIWGRNPDKAKAVAGQLAADGLQAEAVTDLETSVSKADIISCVTSAQSPIVFGDWLAPGAHLDLIGSFRSDMRESDDQAGTRATVFVDTFAGATRSGDLAQPLADGVIVESEIKADLRALVANEHPGRTDDQEITMFKSAGFALADLAAARLAWQGQE